MSLCIELQALPVRNGLLLYLYTWLHGTECTPASLLMISRYWLRYWSLLINSVLYLDHTVSTRAFRNILRFVQCLVYVFTVRIRTSAVHGMINPGTTSIFSRPQNSSMRFRYLYHIRPPRTAVNVLQQRSYSQRDRCHVRARVWQQRCTVLLYSNKVGQARARYCVGRRCVRSILLRALKNVWMTRCSQYITRPQIKHRQFEVLDTHSCICGDKLCDRCKIPRCQPPPTATELPATSDERDRRPIVRSAALCSGIVNGYTTAHLELSSGKNKQRERQRGRRLRKR